MIGDILLIREEHKNSAESIARKVMEELQKKPKNYKYIVGISGESGTGKSEISHSLAMCLKREHIRVKILHTDNYYTVPPMLQSEWRKVKGIETVGINEYDWHLINRNINDFKDERESMLPIIDIVPEQIDKLITDFKKIDLLILEGLYAIKSDGIDLRIFIDLTALEAEAQGKNPDKKERSEFAKSVLEKEHQNVLALRPLSDLVVNKGFNVIDTKTNTSIY